MNRFSRNCRQGWQMAGLPARYLPLPAGRCSRRLEEVKLPKGWYWFYGNYRGLS